MLGNKRTKEGVRRFDRAKAFNSHIQLDVAQWLWAIQSAMTAIHMEELDAQAIRLPLTIDAPAIDLYTRKWMDGRTKKQKRESFEAIKGGAVITIDVVLLEEPDPADGSTRFIQTPTIDEFRKLMTFVGKMLGLSPWGSRFGYGRFSVESIKKK